MDLFGGVKERENDRVSFHAGGPSYGIIRVWPKLWHYLGFWKGIKAE